MSEKIKEAREWITFAVSIVVIPLLWVAKVEVHNQRLEMGAEIAKTYVSQDAFNEEKKKLEGADQRVWEQVGITNGKLDELKTTMATVQQMLFDLRDTVKKQ